MTVRTTPKRRNMKKHPVIWIWKQIRRRIPAIALMTAVVQLVNQIQMPFMNISGVLPQYLAAVASAERLQELDDIQGEPEAGMADPLEVREGRIRAVPAAETVE